jgi:hypothetical protein
MSWHWREEQELSEGQRFEIAFKKIMQQQAGEA